MNNNARTVSELEPLVHTLRPWLSRPNIVGLSAGFKTVGGAKTDEPAIIVHVERKLPLDALGPDDLPVPPEVSLDRMTHDGEATTVSAPTDVIEVGVVRLQALDQRIRPIPGAYQITAAGIDGTGTLGVNLDWAGKYRLLTNNHVISENGLGSLVYQPTEDDNNEIGKVDGFTEVYTYPSRNEPKPRFNYQDLAWHNWEDGEETGMREIANLWKPNGYRPPRRGEKVKLIGKQTAGVKHATIESIEFQVSVKWSDGQWAWFGSMILLDRNVTQAGDSGCAYLAEDDDMVVGLHIGVEEKGKSFGCQL